MKKYIAVLNGSLKNKDFLEKIAVDCRRLSGKYGLTIVTNTDGDSLLDFDIEQVKKIRGETLGIFEEAEPKYDWLYDQIVLLPKGNLYATLKRTCLGIIFLGIPLHKNEEVDEGFPSVIVASSNNVCDTELIGNLPLCERLDNAFLYIIRASCTMENLTPTEGYQKALEFRRHSYPFGDKGEYLQAAEAFHEAAFAAISTGDFFLWAKSMTNYFNCLGDHFYYHVEDFLRAASLYWRAFSYLEDKDMKTDNESQELSLYSRSILVESVALAFDRIGELALAELIADKAADRYNQAKKYAPQDSLKCYQHTVVGLRGYSKYLKAKRNAQEGNIKTARILLEEAKELYKRALRYQPLWKESGFSDNFNVTEKEIAELEEILKT